MTALSKATITIKEIYPPSGKGPSRVLDGTGNYWKVWADVLDELNLKKGSTYDIGYKADTYQGKPDNTIKAAVTADTGAIIAQTSGAKPATNGHAEEYSRARTNPVDSDRMGTMGMVNAFISIGAVAADAEAIAGLIKKCREGLHGGWAE